ncbi:MAG: aspartate/glutamate racemase family protein [Nocardioidaceae bacterium]
MVASTTIGLLYPGYGAEDDFPALEARLDGRIRLPLVHTSVGEDAHRVDALLDLGRADRLAEGAEALRAHDPDAVMWACTSGSFVFGWEGARRQVDEVAERLDRPVSSTSIAFVEAARFLGLQRVAIAASYPDDVARHFEAFLRAGGIEVTAMGSQGIVTAREVGELELDGVIAMIEGTNTTGADGLLVPDTAMHSLGWLAELESAAGMPVLTANQVTVWQGVSLVADPPRVDGLGTLFGTPAVARSRGGR